MNLETGWKDVQLLKRLGESKPKRVDAAIARAWETARLQLLTQMEVVPDIQGVPHCVVVEAAAMTSPHRVIDGAYSCLDANGRNGATS